MIFYVKIKSILIILLAAVISMSLFGTAPAFAKGRSVKNGKDIKIKASAGVVMNADTGDILYSKNGSHRYYPASCTKVMTALVALETWGNDLDKVLTVSKAAVYGIDPESSHIALDVGEKITRKQALYALLLASANDAAVVIAEDAGGSIKGFAEKMNKKADELGLSGSHFVDPHGLYDKEHYTTSEDLAKIMDAALKNPEFVKIFSTIEYTIPKTNKSKKRILWNNHRMVKTKYYHYPGVIGGKSGYVTKSRFNLITVCEKDNMDLIVVVMHGNTAVDMVKDTKKLLDYYYSRYKSVTMPVGNVSKADICGIKGVKVTVREKALSAVVPKSVPDASISTKVKFSDVSLPVKKGQKVGTVFVMYKNQVLASEEITSAQDVSFMQNQQIRIATACAAAAVIVIVILLIRRKRKSRNCRQSY